MSHRCKSHAPLSNPVALYQAPRRQGPALALELSAPVAASFTGCWLGAPTSRCSDSSTRSDDSPARRTGARTGRSLSKPEP
jgi:hypothetical protein